MSKWLVIVCLLLKLFWSCEAQGDCVFYGEKQSRPGVCKELKLCKEVLHNYKRHQIRPQYCGYGSRIVCCPAEVVVKIRPPSNRISAQKCQEYSQLVKSNGKDTCAFTAIKLIIGGNITLEREFPHMALIGYRKSEDDFQFLCGGSLISENFILSAAHCAYSSDLKHATLAKLGDVQRGQNNTNTYLVHIQERIRHPEYKSQSIDHDIALLRLRRKFVLNPYVRPICLPHLDEQTEGAIATGWGQLGFGLEQSTTLMKVALDIFNQSDCQSKFEKIGKARNGIDYATKICAGSYTDVKDSCAGDSGGPLQIYNLDEIHCMYTIIGVTSYGNINCGALGFPAVYTRVFPYLDWIENIVWPKQKTSRTSTDFVFET